MKTVKIKYFILLFLFIIIIPSIIFAKDEVTIETSQYDLEINDEFVITTKISSDHKLYALTATLSYDESVFEAIDDRSFENDKQWSEVIYNPENNKFGLINKSGELSDTLLSVRLKVKEDARVGATSIYLTNISASDGTDKITFEDSSVDIFVSRDANSNEAVPTNNNKFTQVKVEDTVIEASTSKNIPIIIIVSVLLIISIVAGILAYIFDLRNKKQVIIGLFVISVILISILVALIIITNKEKQDVNNDGKIDYADAKQIIKYIIDIDENKKIAPVDDNSNENTQNNTNNNASNNNNRNPNYSSSNNNGNNNNSSNKRPNGDVNNDGKVDIEDAGDVTQDVTEKTKYNVTLSKDTDNNYYVTKNQEISLNFKADVKPDENIKSVVIDNKEYPVVKNSSSYTVVLNAPDTAGVHEFNFSKVISFGDMFSSSKPYIT